MILWYCGIFVFYWLFGWRGIFYKAKEKRNYYYGIRDEAYYLAFLWASTSEEFKDNSPFIIMLDW